MNQFNGKYGCPSCRHPGKRISTQVYPPGTEYPLRTNQTIISAAAKAENEGTVVYGIKGKSALPSMVDLALGAPIDYMHCVLEGVVKRLLEKWVNSSSHRNYYYLNKEKLREIDANVIIQLPPHDFSRAPRSIDKHRKFWKASEFRTWLLFYSLPLLLGYLPPLYIHHYALLVCALHILLQPQLTPTKTKAAEEMLKDFVHFLPELYSEADCTLNAHLLLHLCDHVRIWGPLWGFSAFGFESKNGHLMGHVHATYRVAEQLLFSLNLNQSLDVAQDKLLKTETEKTLAFMSLDPSRSNHSQELIPGSYVVGPVYSGSPSLAERRAIELQTGEWPEVISEFSRVHHQGTLLYSEQYGRSGGKRDSTICSYYKDGREQYGRIHRFLIINSLPLVLIKPFVPSGSLLQAAGVPGRETLQRYASVDLLNSFMIRVEKKTLPVVATRLEAITRKCICVHQDTSQYQFVVKLPNYFEYH